MKITNVRACQPQTPESPPDWRTDLGQILVAVDTDCQITGYGVGGGGLAGIHTVETVLRDLLIGSDPGDIEALWKRMHQTTLAYGQKGLAIMAISGVDLALWDLRGRAERAPVFELLGGLQTAEIPTYITVWDEPTLRREADQGYQGYKLHLSSAEDASSDINAHAERIETQVANARELIGDERELMADAWMRWSLPTTNAVIQRVARYNLSWLEEPLPIDDELGYRQLASESVIPIAGGEHEYTAAAFQRLADLQMHQVLQPDVCWCGGLTELLKIYEIARRHDLRVCPHRGSEIWSLHALASIDPQPLAESGRPWMTWVKGQPRIDGGFIQVPHAPGFGIEIDESRLATMPRPPSRW